MLLIQQLLKICLTIPAIRIWFPKSITPNFLFLGSMRSLNLNGTGFLLTAISALFSFFSNLKETEKKTK
jgi:hypothetical protein